MFKSLLNAADGNVNLNSLVMNILIILGVVIAGALVLYLLWEVVSHVVTKQKNPDEQKETKTEGYYSLNSKKDVMVYDYNLDNQTQVEEVKVEEPATVLDETKLQEVNEVKAEEERKAAEAEVTSEEQEKIERRAYLEARRQEIIRRMQSEMQEKKEEPKEEPVPEVKQEPVVDTLAGERNALNEERDALNQERNSLNEERYALSEEKARYEAMTRELEAARRRLEEERLEQQNQEPKVETRVETRVETVYLPGEQLSLEELKERLAHAEERLRVTEKEFKQCKKEYKPLQRVWTTHERDERKLRRKEALVAKQKVILYGVNNYADIDEEKAKKLAEDLDLLDGLKLSVQHCEEVMKKNEERYPLLERMYNVLQQRNEELKADIAYYKEEIAKLEAEAEENE